MGKSEEERVIDLNPERMDRFRVYWDSMSTEAKRGLLKPRLKDLRRFFGKSQSRLYEKAFSEAIVFHGKHKTWEFWACGFCDGKFANLELRTKHHKEIHKWDPLEKYEKLLPEEVGKEWVDIILNGTWEPKQPSESSDDFRQRASLLERIKGRLAELLRRNILVKKDVEKLIDQASRLKSPGLQDKTPLCICYLEVPKLNIVLDELEHLSTFFESNRSEGDYALYVTVSDYKGKEIKEEITFTDDSCLLVRPCRTSHKEMDVLLDSVAFLRWLFDIPLNILEELSSYIACVKSREHEFSWKLSEMYRLAGVFFQQKIVMQMSLYQFESFQAIYWNAVKKSDQDESHVHVLGSLDWPLTWRREELVRANTDASRAECDAISKVLEFSKKQRECNAAMWQLRAKYKQASSFDYRTILLPLLKLFMQARYEELVKDEPVWKMENELELKKEDFSGVPASTLDKRKEHDSHSQAKKATLQEQKKLLPTMDHVLPTMGLVSSEERLKVLSSDATILQNICGSEDNCLLNAIVQSLWQIRKFRDKFLSRPTSSHDHNGEPCAVCILHEIFTDISKAPSNMQIQAVSLTNLRNALSLYSLSDLFQEEYLNDASKVLKAIFSCLHQSFASGCSDPPGCWDCTSDACVAHTLFGKNISEKMKCHNCFTESRQTEYTSFFHIVKSGALSLVKSLKPKDPFHDLLKRTEMICPVTCNCGKLNILHRSLSTHPHVFTIVLRQTEPIEDISTVLKALAPKIDIFYLYAGLNRSGKSHSLISMVCHNGLQYCCFACSHDGTWTHRDNEIGTDIGSWEDVALLCEERQLQPDILFFEAN